MSDTWGLIARIGNEKARLKELELGEEYRKGLTVMDIASLNAIYKPELNHACHKQPELYKRILPYGPLYETNHFLGRL